MAERNEGHSVDQGRRDAMKYIATGVAGVLVAGTAAELGAISQLDERSKRNASPTAEPSPQVFATGKFTPEEAPRAWGRLTEEDTPMKSELTTLLTLPIDDPGRADAEAATLKGALTVDDLDTLSLGVWTEAGQQMLNAKRYILRQSGRTRLETVVPAEEKWARGLGFGYIYTDKDTSERTFVVEELGLAHDAQRRASYILHRTLQSFRKEPGRQEKDIEIDVGGMTALIESMNDGFTQKNAKPEESQVKTDAHTPTKSALEGISKIVEYQTGIAIEPSNIPVSGKTAGSEGGELRGIIMPKDFIEIYQIVKRDTQIELNPLDPEDLTVAAYILLARNTEDEETGYLVGEPADMSEAVRKFRKGMSQSQVGFVVSSAQDYYGKFKTGVL